MVVPHLLLTRHPHVGLSGALIVGRRRHPCRPVTRSHQNSRDELHAGRGRSAVDGLMDPDGRAYRLHELEVAGHDLTVRLVSEAGPGVRPDLWPSVGEYPCYDALLYQLMTMDDVRNRAYRRAIRSLVAGRRVVDIGTGRDLNWATECLAAGAASVVAIEGLDESFSAARRRAAEMDHGGRLGVLHGWSTDLRLADKAEVCVSEIIGSIGGAEGAAAVLSDARRRLVTADARFIPHRCVTRAGAVCLVDQMSGRLAFSEDAVHYLTQIFRLYGRPFDIRLAVANIGAEALVSEHAPVETLDFNGDLQVQGTTEATLRVTRVGRVDGILLWIQLWCHPDDDPLDSLATRTSWIPAYVPLFFPPLDVRPGDRLDLAVGRSLSDDGVHPDYRVTALLETSEGRVRSDRSADHHPEHFRSDALYRWLFPTTSASRPGPSR